MAVKSRIIEHGTNNMKHKAHNIKYGFTLVEIIVAMGIFSTVVLIATGSLLLLVDAQRKAFALRETYDNLRFSLETIAKDLRTGVAYHCGAAGNLSEPADCDPAQSSITYTNSKFEQITYLLDAGQLKKSINSGQAAPLTSANITIERLGFYVFGSDPNDNIHPRVIMVIVAKTGSGRSATTFTLQTTITQRKVII